MNVNSDYGILNRLSINQDNYHIIEDYFRYYLLTSKNIIPRPYVIILCGILKKRIINAENNSTIGILDASHSKAIIILLIGIVNHYNNMIKLYEPHVIKNKSEIISLLKVYNYYYECIKVFLKKFENTYVSNVKKSLSIFNKIKNEEHNKKTYNEDDFRYKYCFQWINKLNLYFETEDNNIKENIIDEIQNDYFVKLFLSKYNKKDMNNSTFFKLSLDDLNSKYINQNIDEYINC